MKKININSYAKINLSLDVKGLREDGYHEVETVMQQLDLHDNVLVRWMTAEELTEAEKALDTIQIELSTNRPYLPVDERNLAYKAAALMVQRYGEAFLGGKIRIDIKKRIPVAAGLAGGSGNGAAVILALNELWNLNLSLEELCDVGKKLGSDVPFCMMGQAKQNSCLGEKIKKDSMATSCAIGSGTGTELCAVAPLKAYVVLSKPRERVSTAEVYKGIDQEIENAMIGGTPLKHPDGNIMAEALKREDKETIKENMINLLELYTLKKYPAVIETMNEFKKCGTHFKVMMSGSGPTVFAVYFEQAEAKKARERLKRLNRETFLTKTTD